MDNGGGSRDGKEGGDRKGKIAAKLGTKKQRESKRGPGIAKLEAMRIQDEMKMMYLRNHLNQQPPPAVSGTEINSLEGNRMAMNNPLPFYQQQPYPWPPSFPQQSPSSFVGTVVVSNGLPCYQPGYARRGSVPYPIHPNSSAMAYGSGGGASGYCKLPVLRLGTSEVASYANPSNMAPTTLSFFKETPDHHKEGKSAYLMREESHNQSAGEPSTSSKDSGDPHDEPDLDLKL